jgi:ubiquinone/menaquinone biosynthesis C-methylase UbiE
LNSILGRYQRIAKYYDLLDVAFEYGRYRAIRPLLFRGLTGHLLDAGVGTGRNFPFYPPGVSVVGVDQSSAMLARAERRRRDSLASITLREMDVTRLDLPDDAFDAAVASFLFCVLPDDQQRAALQELRRVVRPGGRIRLLEYVRPRGTLRRLVAGMWAPWMEWAYGAGFDRTTKRHIPEAGLVIADERYVVHDLITLFDLRVPDDRAPVADPSAPDRTG